MRLSDHEPLRGAAILMKTSAKSKSPPKAGAKAKPGASEAKPIKVREGEPASRLIDQRIRDLGDGAGRPWPACGR